MYSFMVCVAILEDSGEISEFQWNFLLRGPIGAKINLPEKPQHPQITDAMWLAVNFLSVSLEEFKELPTEITKTMNLKLSEFSLGITLIPNTTEKSHVDWNAQLDDFNKLILIKTLKEEKLVFAITQFVKTKLGKTFIESPQVSLQIL